MLARGAVIDGALNPGLIVGLAPLLATAALALLVASATLILRRRTHDAPHPNLQLKNPFELAAALKLTALIVIIMVAAKVLSAAAGTGGVFLLAAAPGVVDVDALTLSVARLAGGQIAITMRSRQSVMPSFWPASTPEMLMRPQTVTRTSRSWKR